jgi:hypothetical protein
VGPTFYERDLTVFKVALAGLPFEEGLYLEGSLGALAQAGCLAASAEYLARFFLVR